MTEHDFTALEQHIDQLLEHCRHLELENQRLRKQEPLLKEERNRLQHANEATRHKVEAMITRLKSLEQQA